MENRGPNINGLYDILSLKRPHGGKNERYLAEKIIMKFVPELMVFKDLEGNPMVYTHTVGQWSDTLFVAHLDTMHREDGHNPVLYDADMGLMYKTDGSPLGADDGVGVWLLIEMILAGVKGTYFFTVGEERGGVGAKWVANNLDNMLKGFSRAIEFDRRGTSSVITSQSFGRCCSDEFANALAGEMNIMFDGALYRPDCTGVYTDTAEFTMYIPECTNISCGYENEHSGNETQDVDHLMKLREACLSIKWDDLPTKRDPLVVEDTWAVFDGWGSYRAPKTTGKYDELTSITELTALSDEDIEGVVYERPDVVLELILGLKYTGYTI